MLTSWQGWETLARPNFGERQVSREGCSLSHDALDRKPPAMMIENMLHEREPEAGATLRAAVRNIDAIEPLGKPRQVFRRNSRPVILYGNAGLAQARRRVAAFEQDVDTLAGRGIFQRILHEILQRPEQLVAVAQNHEPIDRELDVHVDPPVSGQHLQTVNDLANDRHDIDLLDWTQVYIELNARERQEVVDQPRHPGRLYLHDREEAIPRFRIVARGAAQGLDEP